MQKQRLQIRHLDFCSCEALQVIRISPYVILMSNEFYTKIMRDKELVKQYAGFSTFLGACWRFE